MSERARDSKDLFAADEIEMIYQAYPRHVGKKVALKKIGGALSRISERDDVDDPVGWLTGRVRAFARSPAGQAGRYCPHPATWFNQGRYDDDDNEWYARNGKRDKPKESLGEKYERVYSAAHRALSEEP